MKTDYTIERQRLSTPLLDGYAENARIKDLMRLDAEEARAQMRADPEIQSIDPRLAELAARADRLSARQRQGYSPTRARLIRELTAQYDAIRAGETT